MSLLIDFDFSTNHTLRCKGKENTDMVNQKGEYFGTFYTGSTKWAVVLWDNEEDPNLYKADMLYIAETTWVSVP